MEKIKRWEKIFPIIQNISDMTIFESGWENDSYGNTFGPCTREYYLLHFITEGKGFYIIDGKEYEIEKGQVFLIPPNISTKYYADNENPWKYLWIGFNSTQCKDLMEACGFLDGVYVLPFNKMHIIKHAKKELSALMGDQIAYDYFVHGCLYEIFGYLFHASHNSKSLIKNDTYIQKAKKFIENNFAKKITINDVAKHVGLERSYFSRIFKEKAGISPQQYLIEVRLNHAATLLTQTNMPFNQVALRCAFGDYAHFYKYFYKRFLHTPRQFRDEFKKKQKDAE